MTSDQELVLIFGGLHLVSLLFGAVLFVMFLRSDTTTEWQPPADEDTDDSGGGGNDRIGRGPKPRPDGGVPLPDARQSDVRLRGHGSLRDQRPVPERRPAREPERAPRRVPARD